MSSAANNLKTNLPISENVLVFPGKKGRPLEDAKQAVQDWIGTCVPYCLTNHPRNNPRLTISGNQNCDTRTSGRLTTSDEILGGDAEEIKKYSQFFKKMLASLSPGFIDQLADAHAEGFNLRYGIPTLERTYKDAARERKTAFPGDSFSEWFDEGLAKCRKENNGKKETFVLILSGEASSQRWVEDRIAQLFETHSALDDSLHVGALCSPFMIVNNNDEFCANSDGGVDGSYFLDFFLAASPIRKRIRLFNSLVRMKLHGVYNGDTLRLSSFHAPLHVELFDSSKETQLIVDCAHVYIESKNAQDMDSYAKKWFGENVKSVVKNAFDSLPAVCEQPDQRKRYPEELVSALRRCKAKTAKYYGLSDDGDAHYFAHLQSRLELALRYHEEAGEKEQNDPLFGDLSITERVALEALEVRDEDIDAGATRSDASIMNVGMSYLITDERFTELVCSQARLLVDLLVDIGKNPGLTLEAIRERPAYRKANEANALWLHPELIDSFIKLLDLGYILRHSPFQN